ncbi:DUF1573 domain-containing protein [Flavobacterium sp. NST-5]|uniref:DUF1573 domain-containing protein n=1 Tax=Flavobacterium ichthyis TaxID=2698827 RepID=A0ABW9Z649_9FLAO|nr:DUF1573 domain-containing protein [Flavobacterium ichthyis]NBL64326.1 DUF1573 domain-containing protein [Flavobacterium ichthyis]
MIKKTLSLLALASLAVTISCKDNASSKIQAGNVEATQSTETSTTSGETVDVANTPVNNAVPVMTFEEKEFDFGTIKEGDKVEHIFSFTNTGKGDLLIADAKGSCGCTVPQFKKEPIKPGETSTMTVTFDSTGKPGKQQKSVTITANTATGNELLTIKADVTPKAGGIGVSPKKGA